MQIVADTSALVSLGTAADADPDLLGYLFDAHDVVVPKLVIGKLEATAAYDDASGQGATAVLDRRGELDVRPVDLDETFPLEPETLTHLVNRTGFVFVNILQALFEGFTVS